VRRFRLMLMVFASGCAPDDASCAPDPPEPAAQAPDPTMRVIEVADEGTQTETPRLTIPLDGLCFGIALWVVSSIVTWRLLRRRLKSEALVGATVAAIVGLGIFSFGVFYLYEWLAGRA
jgi:hypothetical protein